ncbi:MAG TPA: hypothetical protein VN841_19450 [Bryobacteraceae bacterium]|nr:hypothetical protein [Bryobacteraceae bacterium]
MDLPELSFHPDAAKRFDERATAIPSTVQCLRAIRDPSSQTPDVHPVETIHREDILSHERFVFELDPTGETTGVSWASGSMLVGWIGAAFQPIKALVDSMGQTKPFRDLVSREFILEQTCHWLCDTLERRRSEGLSEFITLRSRDAVQDFDIWIPLFQTYSSAEFSIGDVAFRVFTREIMEEWWNRIPTRIREDPVSIAALNRRRSELQASLAVCVSVHAENRKAVEIARTKAQDATALLRFLSPANLNSRLTSYCTPNGARAPREVTEVFMKAGHIDHVSRALQERGATDWPLDKSIQLRPGVLENLHRLALDTSTEFRRSLYDALILYSRQTLAIEVSDKLVFTLSALESMLLRDANEPIQKNLGERMAFLIGQTAQERKDIVKNIDEVYRIRSAFVHHGQTSRHVETVDRFLVNAWTTFSRLMDLSIKYRTKAALVGALEDLKMS